MSDADKIKEAEESIQKISSELKSMKNATDLLQDAEKKTDAVLNRAEQILQATQELTGKYGEVVKTLSDFNRHFGEVQTELGPRVQRRPLRPGGPKPKPASVVW